MCLLNLSSFFFTLLLNFGIKNCFRFKLYYICLYSCKQFSRSFRYYPEKLTPYFYYSPIVIPLFQTHTTTIILPMSILLSTARSFSPAPSSPSSSNPSANTSFYWTGSVWVTRYARILLLAVANFVLPFSELTLLKYSITKRT